MTAACGHLILGGFSGTSLPSSFAEALRRGERAGAVLFARNVASLPQVATLNAEIAALGGLVAVDQEGGRVARLKAPVLDLPPMRRLGQLDDVALTERLAKTLGAQLRMLGFHIDFAPVLDVDSNPDNPVIGDRSFSAAPVEVIRHGLAFARGLQAGGVAACGKHFPGHGDTDLDSHLALPTVSRSREAFDAVELLPFTAAAKTDLAAIMSAHVVFPALDEARPATLSEDLATGLLRRRLGFLGVLFSDDLEMGALGQSLGLSVEEAAVAAVRAGCDAVLICSDEAAQARAHRALVDAARRDAGFASRVEEAADRMAALRARFGGSKVDGAAGLGPGLEARVAAAGAEVEAELRRRLEDG